MVKRPTNPCWTACDKNKAQSCHLDKITFESCHPMKWETSNGETRGSAGCTCGNERGTGGLGVVREPTLQYEQVSVAVGSTGRIDQERPFNVFA
jgi:hypothetical protein